MAVNAAGLKASTSLPGFPTDSFLAFALAVPFIQGALFATLNAGQRPRPRRADGISHPARADADARRRAARRVSSRASSCSGVFQAVFYITVGLLVGVGVRIGPGGLAVLLVFAAIVSLGFGALGSFLALRTGSGEAVQAFFPVFFVFLFISSMNTPRDLIAVDWFRAAATPEPGLVPHRVRPEPHHQGWDAQALALGFGIAMRALHRLDRACLVGARRGG